MLYSTIVDKNEEGLLTILEAAEKFEQGSYLHAIYSCHLKKEEILGITEYVKENRAKLSREHYALSVFSLTFNREYATNNNNCFEIAEKLFYKIRSTVSASKKIYKKFCRTVRTPIPYVNPQSPSVFKRSELVNSHRAGQLFGLESYDQCVSILYQELEGFFMELVKCLALCRMIINDENNIRNTPERCMNIYRDCYNQMLNNSKMVIRTFRDKRISPDDSMDMIKNKGQSFQDYICSGFHRLDYSQFQAHVVASELKKGEKEGMTDIEVKLFGAGNRELVMNARLVVKHFDELEKDAHKGKHKDKHSAYCVASFMQWCGIGNEDQKVKMFVEEYFNVTYKGEYPSIKTNSVNSAKNKIVAEKVYNNFDNDEFHDKIEELVGKYTQKERTEMKLVANF